MTRIPPMVSVGPARNSLSRSSLATLSGAAHGISNIRRSIALGSLENVCRFGGTFSLDDLAETPEVGDWKMPDFKAACSYAASQGWLIVQDNALTLTALGLAASSKPA